MLRASVLIPTHEHAATLPFAVASVQAQRIDDIEILIVGDGVDDTLRAVVDRLQAEDSRIRFFDFSKGPRHGEIHRDVVLRQARGRIVCYQCDDDLWLPGHLQDMEEALEAADFAGSMHADVSPEGRVRSYFFDLERPEFKEPWLAWEPNRHGEWASDGFGLAFAAHRLDAYLRLPEGWTTTPPGYPTDQTMFMKFVRAPWCRIRVLPWPVSLHFPEIDRRGWTDRRRTDELSRWMKMLASSNGTERLFREVLRSLGDTLLQQSVADAATRQSEHATRETVAAERDTLMVERDRLMAERDTLMAERDMLMVERKALLAELDAIHDSTSWHLTAPMRAIVDMFKRLKSRQGI
jgi:GalNAc5-diNAcBac-PP-undecaprenol beta-1,3-glucosyltransferase